ncbi:TetR/AcrR family transcriptional regulator [Marinomonas pollencensis]|uniref:TetR family transcriptional regulator n=1 Tax=Marinomonas pollencensis TaxID=491954 RepID=A0A3E0DSV6_9GAMM|nr:TetR/AcrR family transcriptional regulator [Marinomonas pollencensis]REG86639.1 TetR family transcriptional regulator [Marinomonas pollencensis]
MRKNAKFDRDQVVDKATNLYWEKGFHATSMRNLQDVIDMRPGSIYATFGSKEGLFKEALIRYTEQSLALLQACRRDAASPIEGLKRFIKKIVIDSQTNAPNGMCMLAKTVAELGDENAELLAQAKQSLQRLEGEFEVLIADAQAIQEVADTKSAHELARHIQIQISGLRVYAKTHGPEAPLDSLIDDLFLHYPF